MVDQLEARRGGLSCPEGPLTRIANAEHESGGGGTDHPPRPGAVGMLLATGEVVLTATGRMTSPFPPVRLGTSRAVTSTVRAAAAWLLHNAAEEALARGNLFARRQFLLALRSPRQADTDSAECFLFTPRDNMPTGQVACPTVRPRPLHSEHP
ncbi:hypothetical protein GHT07_20635 [Caenimonas koreensis DSM 17982]|uniref:Uncharacterized protein n=1 Tax=Caenimonas koreensis DSM 17982 TaxID=1121255 RepID=A0A844B093_9BURK|nr:hypothetical protein [Caenimonas koreensis]MRD49684.1 hypothetical protein [Caenimonas koreensis DSM 17982]